jgi:hypothetical protein
MIKPLRKRHLQIWTLWALLLPIGILSATIARRSIPANQLIEVQNGKTLPVVIAERKWQGDIIQLRGNSRASIKQLVWVNKLPLQVASATVYVTDSDTGSVQKAKYVGRIESRGNYVFDLLPANEHRNELRFIVYDFIHQQIIDRINFKL